MQPKSRDNARTLVRTLHSTLHRLACCFRGTTHALVHLPDERIDLVLTVAQVSALDEVLELPCLEAAIRVAELERPQEVRGLLEVGSNSIDWRER